jgi:hypothetical protein
MRKENEIYCSNCGVLINIDSRFCPSCGSEQMDLVSPQIHNTISNQKIEETQNTNYRSAEKDVVIEEPENKIYTKWWFWLILILIVGSMFSKKSDDKPWNQIDDNTYSCCNCSGKGKVTIYGTTTTCKYCYGNGTLSKATYEAQCK